MEQIANNPMPNYAPLRLVRLPAILRAHVKTHVKTHVTTHAPATARLRPSAQAFPVAAATRAGLHEIYAKPADATAATGFALGLASERISQCKTRNAAILWVRHEALQAEAGYLYPPGLVEFGLSPAAVTLVRLPHVQSLLQAGLDAARCRALAAILVEMQGEARAYDLVASRKLALAAKNSGVALFIVRHGGRILASAAETRWQVCSVPSQPRLGNAPGAPAFAATLLRQRSGGTADQSGQTWCVEWNRDASSFENRKQKRQDTAPLSRPVAAIPFGGAAPLRKVG
jgi:protein ImuA